MLPVIVLVVASILFRLRFKSWKQCVRYGLAVMFLFTGGAHFAPVVSRAMASMIPPPFTGAMWIIYVTGVLEIAGAIGLLTSRFHRRAALWLILFLVAVFPANVYAAVHGVRLGGQPAMALWYRTPMQCLLIALLGWSSSLMKRAARSDPAPAQIPPSRSE